MFEAAQLQQMFAYRRPLVPIDLFGPSVAKFGPSLSASALSHNVNALVTRESTQGRNGQETGCVHPPTLVQ